MVSNVTLLVCVFITQQCSNNHGGISNYCMHHCCFVVILPYQDFFYEKRILDTWSVVHHWQHPSFKYCTSAHITIGARMQFKPVINVTQDTHTQRHTHNSRISAYVFVGRICISPHARPPDVPCIHRHSLNLAVQTMPLTTPLTTHLTTPLLHPPQAQEPDKADVRPLGRMTHYSRRQSVSAERYDPELDDSDDEGQINSRGIF